MCLNMKLLRPSTLRNIMRKLAAWALVSLAMGQRPPQADGNVLSWQLGFIKQLFVIF